MNDVNPYASPRCREPATWPEGAGGEPSGWRDGDVLIARRSKAVLPRACARSNRAYRVGRLNLMTLPRGWEVVLLLITMVTPVLQIFLYPTIAARLIRTGRASSVPIWVGVGRVVICGALAITTGLLTLIGEILKLVALLQGTVSIYVAGAAVCGLSYAAGAHLEALLMGLRSELVEPDLVRIRGVNPDYLKRLPEFDPRTLRPPVDGGQTG